MKRLLLLPVLIFLSCTNDKETEQAKNLPRGLDSNLIAFVTDGITNIDTVGCVVLDTRKDTSLTKAQQKVRVIAESYCVDRKFWDTTLAVGGKGEKHRYISLYNYREVRIMFEVNEELTEVFLTNDTFKDSVSAEFYRRGMLSYPENIQFMPKDTTLKFVIDLFVPGDTRMIITSKLDLKGKVKILSTKYEGAF
jgi:hypothetical protein